jgi:hypothetical protein
MRSEYEIWQRELSGKRERNSWPLVAFALIFVLIAVEAFHHVR